MGKSETRKRKKDSLQSIQELTLVPRRGKKPYESYARAYDRSLTLSPDYVSLMEREREKREREAEREAAKAKAKAAKAKVAKGTPVAKVSKAKSK